MANPKWRKLNQFFVVSGAGKKQSGFGVFLADNALDTLEPCAVEIDLVVERGEERNCDKRDLIGQPVKSRMRRFRLTYDRFTPVQAFRMIAYKEGAVDAPVGAGVNEVQKLTRTGGEITAGAFKIALTLEGRTGTTKSIAWNASNAAILAAITGQLGTLGKIVHPGDVTVSGDWATAISLTFAKRLGKANLPLVSIINDGLVGGTISPTQFTAGDNYKHAARRTADGSKVLFSFATGDKGGSIATQKYGDAVVESVDFTCNPDQTDVQMTVVVAARFNPEEAAGFVVPPCVNAPSVKVTDVRIKIADAYQHRDLVNHAINLNDNVPVKAAFAFDDIDVSAPFVAGDQPTQEFTSEFFADANHALYQLALEEYVEGNEVEFLTHFGNPGNRLSIIADETKIKPQGQLEGFSGEADESTVKIAGTPFGITDIPVRYEAYLDVSTQFCQV